MAYAESAAGGRLGSLHRFEEPPMDIGRPQRIIEVEPVSLPLPEDVPDLEPAPREPAPAENDPAR